MQRRGLLAGFLFLFTLGLSTPAYAYLDPGSGSYILQLLAAGALAAGFMLKTFWQKITLKLSSWKAAVKKR